MHRRDREQHWREVVVRRVERSAREVLPRRAGHDGGDRRDAIDERRVALRDVLDADAVPRARTRVRCDCTYQQSFGYRLREHVATLEYRECGQRRRGPESRDTLSEFARPSESERRRDGVGGRPRADCGDRARDKRQERRSRRAASAVAEHVDEK